MTTPEFSTSVRVYFEDTDTAGIVYHANYLKYMERARTEWLRRLGMTSRQLIDAEGSVFVVHHVSIDFHRPAYLDDMLELKTTVPLMRGASVEFDHRISHAERGAVVDARLRCVFVDRATHRPRRIPAALREEFGHAG